MTTRNARLCRLNEVLDRRGCSRSGHYRDINQGLWTQPVHIGPRAVAWPEHEVEALIRSVIAGHNEEARRALVETLHQQRDRFAESDLYG